jgi:hypothetical protein
MGISIKVVDNREQFDAVADRLSGLDGLAARVGLHDAAQAAKGLWHEFGLGVPARPWMGPASDEARDPGAAEAERAVVRVINGAASPVAAVTSIGEVFAAAQRAIINEGRVGGPPLSEQAKRNDPRKLINTGAMVGSIETKVGPDKGDS